jgi:hypothetical protein
VSEHRSTDKDPLLADETRQLYLRLLDSRVPPSVADCPTDGLGQLLDLGLAKVEDEGVLVVAPGQALANLTGVLQVRTRQTLSELAEVSEFLGSCVSSPASDLQVDGSRPVPVRVITNREELLRYNSRLPSVARRSYCSVQTSARLARAYQLAGLPAADPVSYSGAVCRIIVDRASVNDARAVIAAGLKRGEQIRCHPAPPLKFIVVDNQLTVLPLDESGRSGAVVLSSPAIGSLLAWTGPVPPTSTRPISASSACWPTTRPIRRSLPPWA